MAKGYGKGSGIASGFARVLAWAAMLLMVAFVAAIVYVMVTGRFQFDEIAVEPVDPNAALIADSADEGQGTLATPSNTGVLHVEGSQLVDAAGNSVQLRGVSTHGLAWFPQYANQELFTEVREMWGANVVRLALYSAESGGYTTDGDKAALTEQVVQAARMALAADVYVVVDWHILSDANPLANKEAAKEFFSTVSAQLKDQDNVLYEICNEPNGDTAWADIKAYAAEVAPSIRDNDPDAIIIVGTPTWSQEVDKAAADPIDVGNVMYALHFYAATHQDDLRDRLKTAVEGGLPVFVTEFGICEASGSGSIDYFSADLWVRLMDELNVSYICWNLSNKDEAAALFKPDVSKTSGFTLDDLSDEGLWLVDILDGPGFDEKQIQLARANKKPNETGSNMMAFVEGTIHWQLHVGDSWEQDGRTFFKYEMTGRNYGAGVSEWVATIPFNRDVQLEDSWNCAASASANELTLESVDYNGTVASDGDVGGIGFIVSGPADLAVVDL